MGYFLITCKNCKLYATSYNSENRKRSINKHKREFPDHEIEIKYINTGADTASGHEFDGYI